MNKVFQAKGFTLLELMIVIAIIGMMASWGLPVLTKAVGEMRLVASANGLVGDIRSAQGEAITHGCAYICPGQPNGTAPACGNDWAQGWQVVGNRNGADMVLRVHGPLAKGTTVAGNLGNVGNGIAFDGQGYPHAGHDCPATGGNATATFAICKSGICRNVVMAATGRLRIEEQSKETP